MKEGISTRDLYDAIAHVSGVENIESGAVSESQTHVPPPSAATGAVSLVSAIEAELQRSSSDDLESLQKRIEARVGDVDCT